VAESYTRFIECIHRRRDRTAPENMGLYLPQCRDRADSKLRDKEVPSKEQRRVAPRLRGVVVMTE
jgi:hypothetical protein